MTKQTTNSVLFISHESQSTFCIDFGLIPDMTILDIVLAPNPTLRSMCEPVADFSQELHHLLDAMYESMMANNGIGLAAPQIGICKQVAIIDISSDYIEQPMAVPPAMQLASEHIHKQRLELINPRIISGIKKTPSEEGCLSIPDYRDTITRFYTVTVEACDRHGRPFCFVANELLSFAVQHEVDHLGGILFVDHLSRLKTTLFRKWAIKHLGTADI